MAKNPMKLVEWGRGDGLVPWFPPANGLSTEVDQGYYNTEGHELVDLGAAAFAGKRVWVNLLSTQSNGSRFIWGPTVAPNPPPGPYTATHPGVLFANVNDGGVYRGKDPLLGCGSFQRDSAEYGSSWLTVGDKVIPLGKTDVAITMAVGIGSAPIQAWIPPNGVFMHRYIAAIRHLKRLGLVPGLVKDFTITLGHGVGNAWAETAMTTAQFIAALDSIKNWVENEEGIFCKWFLPLESKAGGGYLPNSPAIRLAQSTWVDGVTKIQGPDRDTYPETEKYDGAHGFPAWRERDATNWAAIYNANLI